ncbi:MAG: head-tail adaptor protein [Brevundimonas sp.]|nr:MAG: head-tail adaptor protein [Brevundimonas sp.]
MDPGEFDKRIRIVKLGPGARDAAGAPLSARVLVGRPWAKVAYPGGREFLQGDGEVKVRKVVFRIYPLAGVDIGQVVEFDGLDHDIQDLRPFDDVVELHTVGKAPVAT